MITRDSAVGRAPALSALAPRRPEPPRAPDPAERAAAALRRSQLRAALTAGAVLVLLLGPLPVLFTGLPALPATRLAGLPLVWLVLGVAVYPALWLIGRWYVTRAERNEARADHPTAGGAL
ncbi:hypothetical protein [Kitasatospora sp. LaBMicrA B282]|uniref:hypothetical protein n=1 Tax=Kitasatospora sp. LaBMicrA B282 TaxID=3420949 RepID=UPI003D1116EC